MAPSPSFAPIFVLLITFVISLPTINAGGFFPCHADKANTHTSVKCSSVNMPPAICADCPLRPTLQDGSFDQCDRVYDSSSSSCRSKLQQYVKLNPCDTKRAEAVKTLIDTNDAAAERDVDYFLYSMCEQCCDCVPMGATADDYDQLAALHSNSAPSLWVESRGNCPAHARYDVCKVLPFIASFDGSDGAPICPQLDAWQNSDASSAWESNPDAPISADIKKFLRALLIATQCDDKRIWKSCQRMEKKQQHLELPPGAKSPIQLPSDDDVSDEIDDDVDDVPEASTINSEVNKATSSNTPSATATSNASVAPNRPVKVWQTQSTAPSVSANSNSGSNSGNGVGSSANSVNSTSNAQSGGESKRNSSGLPEGLNPAECFPSNARVELCNGQNVSMKELQIGDEVLVSSEKKCSAVYMFSHRRETAYGWYVRIQTESIKLSLTRGHMVYANGRLVRAVEVKIGDFVRTRGGVSRVVEVDEVKSNGLYNPHTFDGDIMVDGVVTSTFTSSVAVTTATALLTPIRLLWRLGAREGSLGTVLANGWNTILFV